MIVVPVNEFGQPIESVVDGTRPVATIGTSVTPTQNNMGTAAFGTLLSGASLTDDCYELEVCVHTVGVAGLARDCVVRIGLDPAGGTSFTTTLVDLVCGPAAVYSSTGGALAGGVWHRLPVRIRAGTSIGAAATVNSATLTAIRVLCRVKRRPSDPRAYVGSYVDSFGVTLASSMGTSITPGTASEGAWTQIGAALTRPLRWLDFGYGVDNTVMNNGCHHVDIAAGDASNKRIIIANHPIFQTANEVIVKPRGGEWCDVGIGETLFARSQAGGTLETGHSVAIYGVGG